LAREGKMNEHEEQLIRIFVDKEARERYSMLLGNPKRRAKILDSLNHSPRFEPGCFHVLPSTTDVPALLRRLGSPEEVYLISDVRRLDGKMMPLDEAVDEVDYGHSGTVISCIPGKLAYYYGEDGQPRAVLSARKLDFPPPRRGP
jgi:hypothetical protein